MEIVGAFSAVIDRHVERSGGRTDLGELAQNAAAESLATVVGAVPLYSARRQRMGVSLSGSSRGSGLIRPTCARTMAESFVRHAREFVSMSDVGFVGRFGGHVARTGDSPASRPTRS
jgi:hypothetical protein